MRLTGKIIQHMVAGQNRHAISSKPDRAARAPREWNESATHPCPTWKTGRETLPQPEGTLGQNAPRLIVRRRSWPSGASGIFAIRIAGRLSHVIAGLAAGRCGG